MIAYLDLPSGLSGDMFLSCLVDAGWPAGELQRAIAAMNLAEDAIAIDAAEKRVGEFRAMQVRVKTTESHHHRRLEDVRAIIQSAGLPQIVKDRAIAVFQRLARAEAKVHGMAVDQVHFHDVGALDSIADIVGVCAGLSAMGIDALHSSPLPMASGWIHGAHGMMPLPAPATLELLAEAGAPTRPAPAAPPPKAQPSPIFAPVQSKKADRPVELVTPTAAALLAELAMFTQPMMRIERVGVGAGVYEFAWPNIARLWLGEPLRQGGAMVQLQTNIDDMNPQFYESVSSRLFAAGAVDVWLDPVQMKKGRPGVVLCALAPASVEQALADLLLAETTTLGVRVHEVRRHEAQRQSRTVATPFGEVRLKVKLRGAHVLGAAPEYDDCRRLAEQQNVPVKAVWEAALQAGAHGSVPRNAPGEVK